MPQHRRALFLCPKRKINCYDKVPRGVIGNDFAPLTLAEMRAKEPGLFDEAIGEGRLVARRGGSGTADGAAGESKINLQNGAESSILNTVDENTINSPIEQGRTDGIGEPWAISRHGKPLNDRQQALLDQLPEFDSRVEVDKSDISMMDLAALTAKTGDEFAMFTVGSKRLIVRGDFEHVNIDADKAAEMRAQGYKWSGHTHMRVGDLLPSDGDREVLAAFAQDSGVIYDAEGKHRRFFR